MKCCAERTTFKTRRGGSVASHDSKRKQGEEIILKKQYVCIPNDMSNCIHLYILTYLQLRKNVFDMHVITNVDLIKAEIKHIFRVKDKLLNILMEMQEQNLIKIQVEGKLLKIIIQDFKKYCKIYYENLNIFFLMDQYEWKLYTHIYRFNENSGYCQNTEIKLGQLIGCSEKTARDRINKLIDYGLIRKESGKHKQDMKQEANKYYIDTTAKIILIPSKPTIQLQSEDHPWDLKYIDSIHPEDPFADCEDVIVRTKNYKAII